jgi:predicted cupin superfamily sugar epimerase
VTTLPLLIQIKLNFFYPTSHFFTRPPSPPHSLPEADPEGGFFKETYRSGATPGASKGLTDEAGTLLPSSSVPPSPRNVCTSIFYLLTREAPIGYWHMNQSNIIHYYQGGDPLSYFLLHPATGAWEKHILGPDLAKGHTLQLIVDGGVWKATVLEQQKEGEGGKGGGWGLLGEAVAPGFDYRDMRFGNEEEMTRVFPQHLEKLRPYLKPKGAEA